MNTIYERHVGMTMHLIKCFHGDQRHIVWRRRPFSSPILVGGEEGMGQVALVSTTCANDITRLWRHH